MYKTEISFLLAFLQGPSVGIVGMFSVNLKDKLRLYNRDAIWLRMEMFFEAIE